MTFAGTQSDVCRNLLPHKSNDCSTWLLYDPDLDLKGGGGRRGPGRPLEATAPPPAYLIAAESSFSSRRCVGNSGPTTSPPIYAKGI